MKKSFKQITGISISLLAVGVFFIPTAYAAPTWDPSKKEGKTVEISSKNQGTNDVAFVGDLDNDGYDELVISQSATGDVEEDYKHHIIYGSATKEVDGKLRPKAEAVISASRPVNGTADVVGADLNSDGFDDLVIGDADGLFIIWGSATRLSGTQSLASVRDAEIDSGNSGSAHDIAVADYNNDGVDDLLLNGNAVNGSILFGTLSFLGQTAVTSQNVPFPRVEATTEDPIQNHVIQALGDLNNDGYIDWARTVYEAQSAVTELYYGSMTFFDEEPYFDTDFSLTPNAIFEFDSGLSPDPAATAAQGWIQTIGNVNGDDYVDIVVSYEYGTMQGGNFDAIGRSDFLLLGSATPLSGNVSLSNLTAVGSVNINGSTLIGDINGDGTSDYAAEVQDKTYAESTESYGYSILRSDISSYTDINDLLSMSFISGLRYRGAFGDVGRLGALDTISQQAGDLNGDGLDDFVYGIEFEGVDYAPGLKVYLVYGHANIQASEARLLGARYVGDDGATLGLANSRVRLVREDGSFEVVSPFAVSGPRKPKVLVLRNNWQAVVVKPNAKRIVVLDRDGDSVNSKSLLGRAQNVKDIAAANIDGIAKKEVMILTHNGNTAKVVYVTVQANGAIRKVDSITLPTTSTDITLEVDDQSRTVQIIEDEQGAYFQLATFTYDANGIQ